MMIEDTQRAASTLYQFIEQNAPVAVLTGAGISTASGIPDYRDQEGQWKRKQPVQHPDFMRCHLTRQRYWARSLIGWPMMAAAEPNVAHHQLARLSQTPLVSGVITQNVDRLHQKAQTRHTIDLHGRADQIICMSCSQQLPRQWMHERCSQHNPDFLNLSATVAPDGDADLEMDFSQFQVPSCDSCGGILKTDVVFFGDTVPRERVDACRQLIRDSKALLVIGSSLMVYSGYRFARQCIENNQPIALLGLGKNRADDIATLKIETDIPTTLASLSDQKNF
jgi:NAD-dependent SIR2 family protein deacetylase